MTVGARTERAAMRPAEHRVLVVADRELVGQAVRMALISRGTQAACFTLPETVADTRLLIRWVATYQPDVGLVLCEVSEDKFVQRAVRAISQVPLRWLVLTASNDPRKWGAILSAGAVGILPMTCSIAEVVTAVDHVAKGLPIMNDQRRARIIEIWRLHEMGQRELAHRIAGLSAGERAVLETLAEGRSVREIATSRDVAVLTVRTQVKAILRKLHVSSQLAAVACYRLGTEGKGVPPHLREPPSW